MIEDSPVTAGDSDGGVRNRDDDSATAESGSAPQMPAEQYDQLPKDVIFGLLSAERRRRILEHMAEHGAKTTLSDLADHIAALENDTEIRLLNSQQRKRVYVALYQCHLPQLDDADVIEFNQPRGTVERRPNAEQLYVYLAVDPTPPVTDDCSRSEETADIRGRLSNLLPG